MTDFQRVQNELAELKRLARFQRLLRSGMRMLWLWIGGVLLCWGVNQIWGILPDPAVWIIAGFMLAAFPAVAFLLSAANQTDWTWTLDRRLGLREQVSTALQTAHLEEAGPVNEALIQDVLVVLPQIRSRMVEKGWYLQKDLVSLSIVLLLGITLLGANLLESYSSRLDTPELAGFPVPTPIQPLDPRASNNQPPDQLPDQNGEPEGGENQSGGGPSQNNPQVDDGGDQEGSGNSPGGPLSDVLRELGSDLRQQAGTYGLGQALENLDLDEAAEALEDLAEQLDDLSQESRENLSQSLGEAAGQASEAGAPALSDAMQDAARSLQSPEGEAETSLDELADELRALADSPDSPNVAGEDIQTAQSGESEPLSRLEGESGEFELPQSDVADSDLLNPSSSGEGGDEVISDSFDSAYRADDGINQSLLLPNSLYWKWRDVVSRYFQR